MHGEHARASYPIQRAKLTRLQDDFQMSVSTRGLDCRDLVEDRCVLTLKECTARDHHVDFVGALCHRHLGLF